MFVCLGNIRWSPLAEATALVYKMRDFDIDNQGSDVEDPWFVGEEGFEECYRVVSRCSTEFLHFLVNKHKLA